MTFKLGLTGSIGMGKSTTAKLFAENGCAVWDADAAVHRLYAKGGAAVAPIGKVFPSAIVHDAVSRDRLKSLIDKDPNALKKIESIVHPLVGEDRAAFLSDTGTDVTVLDIPLLFETGADAQMDATVCVTVSPETQRARVMERGTMIEEQFQAILAKQLPDAEKRARADYVVVTDTLEHARAQVQDILNDIQNRQTHA
ncbi:Dephospho-CoA kinase [Roseovarius sp. THAF9]|uniref:dephospho-CoA kinase n=1 Tax=Roseovarius sp. THAF9 TaxID=2587847 RepID=UPI001268BDBA|nr:dephospho-CoA kinase [Roseovarius sp. THAF9]QFT94973.1 Dephospho-CoA kinase [Roseovarius sp. THAF9]